MRWASRSSPVAVASTSGSTSAGRSGRVASRRSKASTSPLDVDLVTEPQPVRRIPILIGGMSEAALRRIATRADGWVPLVRGDRDPVATIERGVQRLDELAGEAGRGDVKFRVVYNAADPAEVAPRLGALARAGVTDVMVDVDYTDPEGPERAIATLQA